MFSFGHRPAKSGYSIVSLIQTVEKAVCMLRQAQHERKIINVFNAAPFA
jgi:hypothetical protein